MLEALIVWFCFKHIAASAEEKGHAGTVFGVLFVFLWIGGELLGFAVGFLRGGNVGVAYVLVLLGAFGGGGVAWIIVTVLPEKRKRAEPKFDMFGNPIRKARRKRRRLERDDSFDARPRRQQSRRDYDDDDEVDDDYRPRKRRRNDDDDDEPPRRSRYRHEDD